MGLCHECSRDAKRIRRGLCDTCYHREYRKRRAANPDTPECSSDGCSATSFVQGMCNGCYLRLRRYGRTAYAREVLSECKVEGCDKPPFGHGLCSGHYGRQRKHGDVQADVPLRYRNHPERTYLNAKGYVVHRDTQQLEHRMVMAEVLGRPLTPEERPHHKNLVRHDNRPENLELWITSQPAGARVEDMIEHWTDMLRLYAPERLAEQGATQAP